MTEEERKAREIQLLQQADPSLVTPNAQPTPDARKQREIQLLMQADPGLSINNPQDPRVSINGLDHIPPTTPKRQYTPIQALTEWPNQFPKDAAGVLEGMKNAVIHPRDTAVSLANMVGGIPFKVLPESLTKGFTDRLGQVSGDKKTVDKTVDQMKGATSAAIDDLLNKYRSDPNEPVGSALLRTIHDHPAQLAADLFTVLPGAVTARLPASARRVAVPTTAVNEVAGAVVNRGVPAAVRYVEDVTHPTNAFARRMSEGLGPEINNSLSNPAGHQIVQGIPPQNAAAINAPHIGSTPTGPTAVANDVTATNLQAAGNAAERRASTAAQNIKNTQNEARLGQVQSAGQANLDQMIADRARLSDAHYTVANRVMSPVNNELYQLWGRPEIAQAFRDAEESMHNNGRQFGSVDAHGNLQFSGEELQKVKVRLDAAALKLAKDGADADTLRDIMNARNAFTNWFERNNDSWRIARETYRNMSQPINEAVVGRHMEQKMTDAVLGADTAAQRAGAYSEALRNADQVLPTSELRRQLGKTRTLRESVSPQYMQALESVRDDFAREALADAEARAGGKFAPRLDNIFSDAIHIDPHFSPLGLPVGRVVSKTANNYLGDAAANMLLTPEGTRQLVRNALLRDVQLGSRRGLYDDITRMIGSPYRFMNEHPAIYNALNAANDKEKQKK